MKVIFMGTPDFSVGTLEALIGAGHEVVLVVTQPDKPKGRGGKMQYTPVKEAAVAHGIPVFQPVKIISPVSNPSFICIVVTPDTLSPLMTAHWIGAAPR